LDPTIGSNYNQDRGWSTYVNAQTEVLRTNEGTAFGDRKVGGAARNTKKTRAKRVEGAAKAKQQTRGTTSSEKLKRTEAKSKSE